MDDLAIGAWQRTGAAPAWSAAGTEDDFQVLFGATYPGVVRTVERILDDRAVAEEVAQEAFIELHLRWRKVRRYDAPAMWVRRVAIRKAERERRRGWRRGELERTLATRPTLDGPQDPDDEVLAAVGSLPFKQRAVVVLFYLEDRPMDEIATLIDCSVSSGWSLLHVARRKLAALLAEEVSQDVC